MTSAPVDPGTAGSDEARAASLLGRASALTKLLVAVGWLVVVVVVPGPGGPLVVVVVALAAAWLAGGVAPGALARGLAPLAVAAAGIAIFTALFTAPGPDVPAALRTGSRLLAIGAISLAFSTTTTPTALADALVQQARLSDRFAYGALAAYGALPRLRSDLQALRDARELRGLRADVRPRLLAALLVRAIRHADRLGVAMDARGFGTGPRSHFRPLRWGWPDLVTGFGGMALAGSVLLATLR